MQPSSLESARLCRAKRIPDFFQSLIVKFATSPKANSGLVVLEGEKVPTPVQDFSTRALHTVLGLKEARALIAKFNLLSFAQRSEQGLVGALAGIGNLLAADHTFELLSLPERAAASQKITSTSGNAISIFPRNVQQLRSVHGPDHDQLPTALIPFYAGFGVRPHWM